MADLHSTPNKSHMDVQPQSGPGWKTRSLLITFITAVDEMTPFAGSNETANKIKMQNKFVNVKFELRIKGPQ